MLGDQSHPRLARLARSAAAFRREEDGSMLVFGLLLFVLMIMMGGIAVDVMRFEQRRTLLQATLDRSTLASASMTQDLDPETVVRDYFAKAGLTPYLTGVTVTQGLNFRNVRAQAMAATSPYFMKMVGIDDLDAKAVSIAEQRINNVEIMLVLDVSGSMGDPISSGGTKIAALRTAAKEFVATVRANDAENRISIGIVPYNAQVNLGPKLLAKYNAQYPHGKAGADCLEIPASAYSSTTLPRDLAIPMYAYADVANSYSGSSPATFWCNTTTNNVNVVRLPKNNVATLQSEIQNLVDGGNTSIMMGMKWGLTLLDPGARGMYSELVGSGDIPANLNGRPFDWDDDDSMKVIILMTDGEHVAHGYVKDAYKSGLSGIWKSSDGKYSLRKSATQWWGNSSGSTWAWRSTPYGTAPYTEQTWPEIWAKYRVSYVAYYFFDRSGTATYSTQMSNFTGTFASASTMNDQLQQSCTLAKDNGIIIYGIAFQAPTNGQTQISRCASTEPDGAPDAHYFDATDGTKLQTAFRAIANNISQLRLTQ